MRNNNCFKHTPAASVQGNDEPECSNERNNITAVVENRSIMLEKTDRMGILEFVK